MTRPTRRSIPRGIPRGIPSQVIWRGNILLRDPWITVPTYTLRFHDTAVGCVTVTARRARAHKWRALVMIDGSGFDSGTCTTHEEACEESMALWVRRTESVLAAVEGWKP